MRNLLTRLVITGTILALAGVAWCVPKITITSVGYDGYYREKGFTEPGITVVTGEPKKYNRILSYEVLDRKTKASYAMYRDDFRDATLFYRTQKDGIPRYHAFN